MHLLVLVFVTVRVGQLQRDQGRVIFEGLEQKDGTFCTHLVAPDVKVDQGIILHQSFSQVPYPFVADRVLVKILTSVIK
jgi:hypothetical protein